MSTLDLYIKLTLKGYRNDEIEDILAEFDEDENPSNEAITHIKCVLELDRREVFRTVYPYGFINELIIATGMYAREELDYTVDYVINKLSTESGKVEDNEAKKSL